MRILIADDSVLLREGLSLLLGESGHDVVGAVGSGTELVPAALQLRPDLVISDIRMPPSNTDEGLRAALEIRSAWADAPILMLSQYIVLTYAKELLAAGSGAIGYLLKDRVSDIDSFLTACEQVAAGGMVLDPGVVAQVMGRNRKAEPLAQLTPRETEVLAVMAQGRTNAGIARELFISEGAVEKHSQRIFAKLGLQEHDDVHRRVRAVLTFLQG